MAVDHPAGHPADAALVAREAAALLAAHFTAAAAADAADANDATDPAGAPLRRLRALATALTAAAAAADAPAAATADILRQLVGRDVFLG